MQELREGQTTEGFRFMLTLTYVGGAPDGAWPERVTGAFQALDGYTEFLIERVARNEWARADTGDTAESPDRLLPWVVADGVVERRSRLS
jgi:hypothetical protein